jgi:hypothetical protein
MQFWLDEDVANTPMVDVLGEFPISATQGLKLRRYDPDHIAHWTKRLKGFSG